MKSKELDIDVKN